MDKTEIKKTEIEKRREYMKKAGLIGDPMDSSSWEWQLTQVEKEDADEELTGEMYVVGFDGDEIHMTEREFDLWSKSMDHYTLLRTYYY